MTRTSPPDSWLAELQARLGADAREIAATLLAEMLSALARAGEAVQAADLDAVGHAAHAARSSALLIEDAPLLAALRELEEAARALDGPAAGAAHARVMELWEPLRERLQAAAAAPAAGAPAAAAPAAAAPAAADGAGAQAGGT